MRDEVHVGLLGPLHAVLLFGDGGEQQDQYGWDDDAQGAVELGAAGAAAGQAPHDREHYSQDDDQGARADAPHHARVLAGRQGQQQGQCDEPGHLLFEIAIDGFYQIPKVIVLKTQSHFIQIPVLFQLFTDSELSIFCWYHITQTARSVDSFIPSYYLQYLLMRSILISLFILYFAAVPCSSIYCQPNNCYDLLQVPSSASAQEIKKSYRALARLYHPDGNPDDTLQLFQAINSAYEVLSNQHTRRTYDRYLSDPSGSRMYHTYEYYRASYTPQVNPVLILVVLLALLSWFQWVMRRQMYQSALEGIVNSEGFRKRVNEQCELEGRKGDKYYKEQIAERLQKEITIQGGYSLPKYTDLLAYRFVMLPFTLVMGVYSGARWVWKYYIKREDYDPRDQEEQTRRALKVPRAQWESMAEEERKGYVGRRLWVRDNMRAYQEEMQQRQLEQIRETNPAKYRKIMAYLKKQK